MVRKQISPEMALHERHVRHEARRRMGARSELVFYFEEVSISVEGDVLILTGRVRTANLKQALSSILAGIAGVREMDNRVFVLNSTGLSGESTDVRTPASNRHDVKERS